MSEGSPIPVTIFLGPTAVGKSALALEVATRGDGEIISADSMQIYRGMDIGTAKPSHEERTLVPHHLIDIVQPEEEFNVADFIRSADAAAEDIHRRGKRVFMVGGTALYLKAFMEGIFEAPGDADVRARLVEQCREIGAQAMHDRLREVDLKAARRIHANDERRIVRALEVFEVSGQPISEWQVQEGGTRDLYEFRLFGLRMEREALYNRINTRVTQMIQDGLIEETECLMERPEGLGKGSMQALGYREIMAFLNGEMEREIAIHQVKQGTRRFAKSQISWFKRFPNVTWIDIQPDSTAQQLALEWSDAILACEP
ncbi:MAG: tRNA (adenosine(37)-N6)-dimethylallyltransferase MiaA [Planctomycetota bacterium]|nr:tRNA (adenosine(37)-N6)-dimethylallyltransferase MiaA [Planctomycetota bacterium]